MLIGFNAPTGGPLSAADNLTKIVVGGEAMGFDYATFSDHVVIPTAIAAEYPYSASGEFPSGTRGERHEQLTEITWIAAKTTRLRLVTSVMVVPHRPAVLTAKILDHRRSLGWPADAGYRCGLDARGVRGHRRAGLRCALNSDRRICARFRRTLDEGCAEVRRQACPILQYWF